MTVTIPTILASRPAGLIDAAQLAQQQAQTAADQLDQGRNALADMRKGWDSAASDAASANAERTFASHRKIVDALHDMQAALQRGGDQMSATRTDVAEIVGKIQPFGFEVADDGTVTIAPGSRADEMASRSPVFARQMQMLAMQYSVDLKRLIAEFDTQDNTLANALQQATGDLDLKEVGRMGPAEEGKPSADDTKKDASSPAEPGKEADQTTPGATPAAVPPVPPVVPGPANPQAAPRPAAATPPPKPGGTPTQTRAAEPGRPSNPAPPPTKGPVPAQPNPTQPSRQSGPVPTAPPTTPGTPAQGSGSTATAATPASYSAAQTSSSSGAPESNIQAVSSVVGGFQEGITVDEHGMIIDFEYDDLDYADDFDDDW